MLVKKILITGYKSGLGKYLYEDCKKYCKHLNAFMELEGKQERGTVLGLDKDNKKEIMKHDNFDLIIHCAFSRYNFFSKKLIDDNIKFTEKLLKKKHNKFVYISSIDIYPSHMKNVKEGSYIEFNKIDKPYGILKLMCEQLVKEKATEYLILRPGMLIDSESRLNSIRKIVETKQDINISINSTFNCVPYDYIGCFIYKFYFTKIRGIYNIVSGSNIKLKELHDFVKSQERCYGSYEYITPTFDNTAAQEIMKELRYTSLDVIKDKLIDKKGETTYAVAGKLEKEKEQ